MRKSVLVALAGCRRDVQSIDEPAPTATTVARVGLAEPFILNRHGDVYGETRAHSIVEPTPTAKSQADASRNLSLGGSDEPVQETKTVEPVRAAQADASRNLSLGGSDNAVQETEPVSAADPVWAPMPRGPEAKTTKSIDRPKFTGCPPGAEMSRRSRMKAAASHRRAPAQMARAEVGRPHHRGWSVARIVATLLTYW